MSDESGSSDGFVLISPRASPIDRVASPSDDFDLVSLASGDATRSPSPARGRSTAHTPTMCPALAPPPMMRGATDFTLVDQSLDELIAKQLALTDVSPWSAEMLSMAVPRPQSTTVWEGEEDEEDPFDDDDDYDTGFNAYDDDVSLSHRVAGRPSGQRSRQTQKASAPRLAIAKAAEEMRKQKPSLSARASHAPPTAAHRRPPSSSCCLVKKDKSPYTIADVADHLSSTSAPATSTTQTSIRPGTKWCPEASPSKSGVQPQMTQFPSLQTAFYDHWRSVIECNFHSASRSVRLKSVSAIDHAQGPFTAPTCQFHRCFDEATVVLEQLFNEGKVSVQPTAQRHPSYTWSQLLLNMLNNPDGSGPNQTRVELVYMQPQSCMHSDVGARERFGVERRNLTWSKEASLASHSADACRRHCQWSPASSRGIIRLYTPDNAHHMHAKKQLFMHKKEGLTQKDNMVIACAMLHGSVGTFAPGPMCPTLLNTPRQDHVTFLPTRYQTILVPMLEINYADLKTNNRDDSVSATTTTIHPREARSLAKRAVKLERRKCEKTADRSRAAARQDAVDNTSGKRDQLVAIGSAPKIEHTPEGEEAATSSQPPRQPRQPPFYEEDDFSDYDEDFSEDDNDDVLDAHVSSLSSAYDDTDISACGPYLAHAKAPPSSSILSVAPGSSHGFHHNHNAGRWLRVWRKRHCTLVRPANKNSKLDVRHPVKPKQLERRSNQKHLRTDAYNIEGGEEETE